MEIEKQKIKTLDETDEPPPIDQVEERVEAEMELIKGKAKEEVATSLNNAEGKLKQLREEDSKP